MDGFHPDNSLLTARDLLPRKGAPETFDADGFINIVKRIANDEEVIFPLFDRVRDMAVAAAGPASADCKIVIVEGNYLLFDEPPWRDLRALRDLSVFIDVPMAGPRRRSVQRWRAHGHSKQAAEERARSNDMPNAKRVIRQSAPADLIWTYRQMP